MGLLTAPTVKKIEFHKSKMADGRHCENRRITIYAYVHSIFTENSVRLSIGDLTTGLAF